MVSIRATGVKYLLFGARCVLSYYEVHFYKILKPYLSRDTIDLEGPEMANIRRLRFVAKVV